MQKYRITYFLGMQFPVGIDEKCRSQSDYVYLFHDDFKSNVERLYNHYAQMFPTFDLFKKIYNGLHTYENCYDLMVINNKNKSTKLSERIFWYKSTSVDTLYICGPDLEEDKNSFVENKSFVKDTNTSSNKKTIINNILKINGIIGSNINNNKFCTDNKEAIQNVLKSNEAIMNKLKDVDHFIQNYEMIKNIVDVNLNLMNML